MKKALRVFLFCSYLILLYTGFLYFAQTDLLFHPDLFYISPSDMGINEFRENILTSKDGTKIMTWFYPGDKSKPALLFFHGNSNQIATFIRPLKPFIEQGYPVLAMEYRTFGNTSGEISQENIMSDTAMAYDFLKQEGYDKIVAYGYSFGTAFASALTSLRPVDSVILIAPFSSLSQLVSEKPIPLASLLLKDTYPSVEYLKDYHNPLLIVHGKQDKLIPYHHSENLYQQAKTNQKEIILSETDNHGSIYFHPTYLDKVFKFLNNL